MRTLNVRPAKRFGRNILCIAIIMCIAFNGTAQICQGSLGDPIVNTTFGSGPNPGPPLSAATTNYTYVATDCPKDGNYAVRNKTEYCFDTLWYPVTDHTGDANGYFMLVNASYDPGQFYLDTVKNLCAGSTYEFAAWLINVSKPILCWGATQIITPNITFRIEKTDGTLLGSYNTGNIAATDPPQWKQYGFFFTTPSGVNEVVIRMVNNAPGGCGNDVGLDDITFRACGPQVTTTISGLNSNTDTVCGGTAKSYTFQAQSSGGYNNPVYQWQKNINGGGWADIPGETSTAYDVSFSSNEPAGEHMFRLLAAESGNMASTNCRVASSALRIIVTPRPNMSASGNSPVCEGTTISLSATGNNIKWSGPNGFTATGNNVSIPNAKQSDAGDYVAFTQVGNCGWSEIVNINITPKPFIGVIPDSAAICEGDSILLSADGANNYSWQPANGLSASDQQSVKASPRASTTYIVTGSNTSGCSDTATAFVRVNHKPIAKAGLDIAAVQGTTVQLNGSASGDSINYYWTPKYALSDDQSLHPTLMPLADTSYVLHVVSTAGCGRDSDAVRITIYKEIAIPNAFSPNGDNTNDRWNIPGLNSYPQSEVILFDRYGREVFRRRNYQPWDGNRNGQPVPVGVYYYVISLGNGSPKITGHLYVAR
jgi:gliding motility-associated-like protein